MEISDYYESFSEEFTNKVPKSHIKLPLLSPNLYSIVDPDDKFWLTILYVAQKWIKTHPYGD